MYKIILLVAVVLVFGAFYGYKAVAQAKEVKEPMKNQKVLIAYYSRTGHTKNVAEAIHKKIGGDMFEIQTVDTYPEDYDEMTTLAKKEITEGFRPKLKSKVENIDQYDTIFLGSPDWWGTIATPVSSFIEDNNLAGKTVIPFITHGGGGEQNTIKDMTAQCKGCLVKENGWVSFRGHTLGISGWLEEMGFKN